jgi:hypothetical protein
MAAACGACCACAGTQRTFVASYGLDANACSLTAPCRSFATALTKTNANGEIIVLDSAGYGPVSIDRSVAIVAAPGVYAGITAFGSVASAVEIFGTSIDVTLRGLTLTGQGAAHGIDVASADHVTIDRCSVDHFDGDGIRVFAGDVSIRDSSMRGNGNAGLDIVAGVVGVEGSQMEDNHYSGIVIANARVSVARASLSGNTFYGLIADGSVGNLAAVNVTSSLVARNGHGGIVASGINGAAKVIARANTISDNGFICGACGHGLSADEAIGSAELVAYGNVVARSTGAGLSEANLADLVSRGDNVLFDNTAGPTAGTISADTPH